MTVPATHRNGLVTTAVAEMPSPTGIDGSRALSHDNARVSGGHVRIAALGLLTILLVTLCFSLAVPFLPAITWGVALAIIAWPMHRWIGRRVGSPTLAAVLSTIAVVAGIVAPGIFVAVQLAKEVAPVAEKLQDGAESSIREQAEDLPALAKVTAWMDRIGLNIEEQVRTIASPHLRDISTLAQGSIAIGIQILCTVFILFYLFRDRHIFIEGFRELLPLTRQEFDQVLSRAADSVHANLYATLITSVIDTIGGGLMFWAVGLPAPVLWAAVMFVLSILPIVGAGLVWLPAAAYLAMSGHWPQGLALFAWGALTFVIVDNALYVRVAGDRMRLHNVPALIAFLGGLAIFGVSGMILGPAILAITVALLQVWKHRMANSTTSHA